jgi:hypothetical protein
LLQVGINAASLPFGKQDHDVLVLFDHSFDGMEQPDNEIQQSLGMINLAPHDWFAAFDPDQARDPDRGSRHP